MKTLTLECPSCQHQFSPDASLQQHVQHLLQHQQSAMQQDFATKEEQLRKFQSKLKQQALEAETLINQQVETRAATLRQELQAQLKQDHADELQALKTELAEKNEIARTVKNKEIELEQLRRAVDQVEADVTLRYERQLTAQQQAIEQRVRQQAEEKYTLQLAEVNKRLSDTRHQLTEAQRKAEQGSTQLQGEVQEQYIEDKLRELFPCDTVQEVAKGVSGADVLQTVRNELHQACGTILYESKRTKPTTSANCAGRCLKIQATLSNCLPWCATGCFPLSRRWAVATRACLPATCAGLTSSSPRPACSPRPSTCCRRSGWTGAIPRATSTSICSAKWPRRARTGSFVRPATSSS